PRSRLRAARWSASRTARSVRPTAEPYKTRRGNAARTAWQSRSRRSGRLRFRRSTTLGRTDRPGPRGCRFEPNLRRHTAHLPWPSEHLNAEPAADAVNVNVAFVAVTVPDGPPVIVAVRGGT